MPRVPFRTRRISIPREAACGHPSPEKGSASPWVMWTDPRTVRRSGCRALGRQPCAGSGRRTRFLATIWSSAVRAPSQTGDTRGPAVRECVQQTLSISLNHNDFAPPEFWRRTGPHDALECCVSTDARIPPNTTRQSPGARRVLQVIRARHTILCGQCPAVKRYSSARRRGAHRAPLEPCAR
jgi:hypothetical protein